MSSLRLPGWAASRSLLLPLHQRAAGLLVARAAGPAVSVVLLAVLARQRGAGEVGLYGLAVAVFSLLEAAASCGLRHLLPRELARGENRMLLGSAVLGCTAVGLLLAGALAMAAWGLAGGAQRTALLLVAAALPLAALAVPEEGYWLGVQRVGRLSGALLTEQAVRLVLGLVVVWRGGGAVPLVALLGVGRAVAVMMALPPGGLAWGEANRHAMWSLARQMPVFLGIEAVFQLYWRVDVILLSALASLEEVGYYVAAYRVFSALLLLPQSYGQVLLPGLASAGGHRLFRRAVVDTLVVGGILGVGLALGSAPLVRLLYGGGFERAAMVLAVLAVGMVLASVDQPQGRALVARGRQARDLVVLTGATLVNVGLNVALIPRHGAMGAAVATLASLAVSVTGHAVALKTP